MADHGHVFEVVAREHRDGRQRQRRSGIGAGLVVQLRLRRRDAAGLRAAHLDLDVGPRGRAGGAEHFVPVHDHLDGALALLGQHDRQRFEIDVVLAAEPAAEFRRNDLDLGQVHFEQLGDLGAEHEMALGAGPYLGEPAFGIVGDAGLRFDIALVNRLGVEFPLDDDIGLGKALFDIAELAFETGGDVRRFRRLGLHALGELVFVEDRRIGLHRVAHVDHVGQHFVIDLDQLQRRTGDGIAGGGDGGDRMAVIEHVFARHHVARDVAEIDHQFARCRVFDRHVGEIVARHHRFYAGQRFRRGDVYRQDIGAGMRAAQHPADQLTGQRNIRCVTRASGDLVHGIAARGRVGADDLEIFFLVRNFRGEG